MLPQLHQPILSDAAVRHRRKAGRRCGRVDAKGQVMHRNSAPTTNNMANNVVVNLHEKIRESYRESYRCIASRVTGHEAAAT